MNLTKGTRAFWGAAALLTLIGLLWRFDLAASLPELDDEVTCTFMAEEMFDPNGSWPAHGGDHPVLGIYLLGASGWLFGRGLLGYRMLSVLAGTLTIPLLIWAVRRSASRAEALVAGLLLTANAMHAGFSAGAFEMAFQILFVTAAWLFLTGLPRQGRAAFAATGACLGLAFMCSESALLVGLAWALAFAVKPLRTRQPVAFAQAAWAGAAFLVMIAPDLVYNLTARRVDYFYVNYVDHLVRIVPMSLNLQGLGFFLRDLFNSMLADLPSLWEDHRSEYVGPGLLGVVLLAGWLHSLRGAGDPSGGLWRYPPLLFVMVTTFAGTLGPSELDEATWTWPSPTIPLVSAATARMLVLAWQWGRAKLTSPRSA